MLFMICIYYIYIHVGGIIKDMVDGSGVKSSALQVSYVTSNI